MPRPVGFEPFVPQPNWALLPNASTFRFGRPTLGPPRRLGPLEGGRGGGNGGGHHNLIRDLGVESAMSDFKSESIFLTLWHANQVIYQSYLILPYLRFTTSLGGGGVCKWTLNDLDHLS